MNYALFSNLPNRIKVGLYHSWACRLEEETLLKVVAESDEKVIMAFENVEKKIFGVQFHPESILTPLGSQIIKNFLEI